MDIPLTNRICQTRRRPIARRLLIRLRLNIQVQQKARLIRHRRLSPTQQFQIQIHPRAHRDRDHIVERQRRRRARDLRSRNDRHRHIRERPDNEVEEGVVEYLTRGFGAGICEHRTDTPEGEGDDDKVEGAGADECENAPVW